MMTQPIARVGDPHTYAGAVRPSSQKTGKEEEEICCNHYTSLNEVITYIRQKMSINLVGDEFAYLRDNLKCWQWDNIIPGKYTVDTAQAYYEWYTLVKDRGDWDYKREMRREYGEWSCDQLSKDLYNVDIWGNIHYGYIGLAAGFPEWDLLAGAGFAQLRAGTVPDGYWQRRLSEIGDADFLAAFDDPRDQEAIKIGFYLWEKCGASVTNSDIVDAVRGATNLLITKPCDKL